VREEVLEGEREREEFPFASTVVLFFFGWRMDGWVGGWILARGWLFWQGWIFGEGGFLATVNFKFVARSGRTSRRGVPYGAIEEERKARARDEEALGRTARDMKRGRREMGGVSFASALANFSFFSPLRIGGKKRRARKEASLRVIQPIFVVVFFAECE
jgi:hypothetical protein